MADHGAVSPRSTPIVRRRSWDHAVATEGINRREGVNAFPLRSFFFFLLRLSTPLHGEHTAAVSLRMHYCRTFPPPDDAHVSRPIHRRRMTRRTPWSRTPPPHAVTTIPHRRGKSPLLPSFCFFSFFFFFLPCSTVDAACHAPLAISSPQLFPLFFLR